jgi:hypothetical protein
MGRLAFSRSQYDLLLQYFRENGHHPYRAAVFAGVCVGTARRAWVQGWPKRKMPPISSIIEQDQLQARANLANREQQQQLDVAAEAQRVRKDAAAQAIRTREQEGELLEVCRRNASRAAAASLAMVKHCDELANLASSSIEKAVRTGSIDPDKAMVMLLRMYDLALKTQALADGLAVAERRFLGEPEKFFGVQVESLDPEEIKARIQQVLKSVTGSRVASGFDAEATGVAVPTIGQRVVPQLPAKVS